VLALYIVTLVLVVLSLVVDSTKTAVGIRLGLKKFQKILPSFLKLLIFVAVVLFFSEGLISEYLGQDNLLLGILTGLTLGSVTMMPGFISYPLAGVLVEKGVAYMVVASFVTSLMMVGVLTYPIEKSYFGVRATLARNLTSLVIAVLISLAIGLFYGEI